MVEVKAPIIDGPAKDSAAARPESWNAKMPSGEPLITDEQFKRLLANAPASLEDMKHHDPVPVVKIFLPHVRWILAWIDADDRDRAYGVMQFRGDKPKASVVRLSEIVRARFAVLEPERDKYVRLDKPLSHYLRSPSL